jgi:hypothetical protein
MLRAIAWLCESLFGELEAPRYKDVVFIIRGK